MKTLELISGKKIPILGQGTWRTIELTNEDLQSLNYAFEPPSRKVSLAMR